MASVGAEKIKVLVTPAHYYLDDRKHGSELVWVAHLLNGIIDSGKYSLDVITGYVENIEINGSDFAVHEIDRHAKANVNVFHALYFSIKKTIVSKRLCSKNDFRIIHHMFPFLIGVTFDLDFILRRPNNKYVLGPLQTPQTFAAADESVAEAPYNKFLIRISKRILGYMSDLTLGNADRVIVINKQTKDMLLRRGVEERNINIINPGIDIERFKYVPFEEKESDKIEIITVGFLIKRKAVDLVIKAIDEVIRSNRNIHLRMIGDGPQMRALKRLSDSLGLNDYITFEGFVPNFEIWEYYKRAHVFVSMSRSESWGQAYVEAMAAGLPVIAASNIGSSEIIKDGVFGYLVDKEDYRMLAQRLLYLIENKDRIADFGQKGRAEVEEKYDWKKVVIPQYLAVYNYLTGRDQDV